MLSDQQKKAANYIIKTGAVIGALALISSTIWAAADYTEVRPVIKKEMLAMMETQKQLTDNLLSLRFQLLMQKKNYGGLTFQEKQELCKTSKTLGYIGVPGCDVPDRSDSHMNPPYTTPNQ